MRTVSLSDPIVQQKIAQSFVPLKVQINYGSKNFPIDWPAMKQYQLGYMLMGGPRTKGMTGCCVVDPDLKFQLASTGSAFVWEMFEAIAYDPKKFAAMLDRGIGRFKHGQLIRNDWSLSQMQRKNKLSQYQAFVAHEIKEEATFHLPPTGFSLEGANQLFKLSGDRKDGR